MTSFTNTHHVVMIRRPGTTLIWDMMVQKVVILIKLFIKFSSGEEPVDAFLKNYSFLGEGEYCRNNASKSVDIFTSLEASLDHLHGPTGMQGMGLCRSRGSFCQQTRSDCPLSFLSPTRLHQPDFQRHEPDLFQASRPSMAIGDGIFR